MADRSLLLLLDEVRRRTIQLLAGLTEEQARWTPSGLDNHILWHGGHCYVLVEWLTLKAVQEKPRIPEDWFDMFSWESRPREVPDEHWPPLAAVAEALKSQHLRLRHIIDGLSEERLASPLPDRPNHTLRYAILHGLHDEACHTGEIWLLRKMLRTLESS